MLQLGLLAMALMASMEIHVHPSRGGDEGSGAIVDDPLRSLSAAARVAGGASIEEEVARLGADPAVLTISSKRVVTQKNFTIPRTTLLVFEMGGSFFLEAGASVMIEGEMKAPKFTIFQGPAAGSVRFGCCPGLVTEAYPQWWGSQTDGVTDDTAAIQAALDSFPLDIVRSI